MVGLVARVAEELMEFADHEEHEEEIGLPPSYDPLANSSSRGKMSGGAGGETAPSARKPASRYRECLKNHAVGIGGHAVDGCGEFMAAGMEGTLDALKCAACNCHRNFHRKETEGDGIYQLQPHQAHPHQQFTPYYRSGAGYLHVTAPGHRPLALPSTSGGGGGGGSQSRGEEQEEGSGGVGTAGGSKKRFRTKFTAEQKERMLELAERLGWRIQKHDEAVVQQFCNDTGVKRHVLKVWMHNNKHTLGKKP